MRKLIALIITCMILLTGCENKADIGNFNGEVSDFSYAEAIEIYKKETSGVHYDGFKNISEMNIDNADKAIEHAKEECTVEYDTINVGYDNTEDIWEVTFLTEKMLGGDQSVYLSSDGKTKLIVYGE